MVCDYNDRGKVFFIWHMIIHSGEKAFPCIISMYECKKGHAVILYNIFMNPKVRFLRTMIYFYCIWSDYQGRCKVLFDNHLRLHSGEKAFQCTKRDYHLRGKSCFKFHPLSHTGEKALQYTECDYQVFIKVVFKLHIIRHIGETTFLCINWKMCDYQPLVKVVVEFHPCIHIGEKSLSYRNVKCYDTFDFIVPYVSDNRVYDTKYEFNNDNIYFHLDFTAINDLESIDISFVYIFFYIFYDG